MTALDTTDPLRAALERSFQVQDDGEFSTQLRSALDKNFSKQAQPDPFTLAAPEPTGDIGFVESTKNEVFRGHNLAQQAHHLLIAMGSPSADLESIAEDVMLTRKQMREIPTSAELESLEGKGFFGTIAASLASPLDIALPMIAGSFASYAETGLPVTLAAGGIGAGIGSFAAPGPGTAVGGRIGASVGAAAGSLLLEGSSTFFDEIEKKIIKNGGDINNTQDWIDALTNPATIKAARKTAGLKAIPVALLDAASVGIAGRLTFAVKGPVQKAVTSSGEVVMQGAFGAAGEAAGQLASTGTIVGGDVGKEFVGEFGPGSVQVAGGTALQASRRQDPTPLIGEVQVSSKVKVAVLPMDPQQRVVAEAAATEVLIDDESLPEDRQVAAEVIQELDNTTAPAQPEATEVAPVAQPTPEQKQQFLDSLGIKKDKARKITLTEKQALKAQIRAQKRSAEIVARAVKAEVQATAKETAAVNKDTRARVRRLVRATISKKRQGKFLALIENATPKNLADILDEVVLAASLDRVEERRADAAKLDKRVKKSKLISNETRDALRAKLEETKSLSDAARKFKQSKVINEASGKINEIIDEVAEAFTDERAANIALLQGKLANTRAAVEKVIGNVGEAEAVLADDPVTSLGKVWKNGWADIRNLTRLVEGKSDGTSILEQLMWREMTRAHSRHYEHVATRR
jgi:hypothetical protein